jgi:hypothetical protein
MYKQFLAQLTKRLAEGRRFRDDANWKPSTARE